MLSVIQAECLIKAHYTEKHNRGAATFFRKTFFRMTFFRSQTFLKLDLPEASLACQGPPMVVPDRLGQLLMDKVKLGEGERAKLGEVCPKVRLIQDRMPIPSHLTQLILRENDFPPPSAQLGEGVKVLSQGRGKEPCQGRGKELSQVRGTPKYQIRCCDFFQTTSKICLSKKVVRKKVAAP